MNVVYYKSTEPVILSSSHLVVPHCHYRKQYCVWFGYFLRCMVFAPVRFTNLQGACFKSSVHGTSLPFHCRQDQKAFTTHIFSSHCYQDYLALAVIELSLLPSSDDDAGWFDDSNIVCCDDAPGTVGHIAPGLGWFTTSVLPTYMERIGVTPSTWFWERIISLLSSHLVVPPTTAWGLGI